MKTDKISRERYKLERKNDEERRWIKRQRGKKKESKRDRERSVVQQWKATAAAAKVNNNKTGWKFCPSVNQSNCPRMKFV